jgi:hypothetical protein
MGTVPIEQWPELGTVPMRGQSLREMFCGCII